MTDAYTDESTRERDMKRKTNKQKNRVELAPWIYQIDRIERMLKWLVVKQLMEDRGKLSGLAYHPISMAQQINEQAQEIPDISDILEEKKD